MRCLFFCSLLLSGAFATSAFWVQAKAHVGQWLLDRAWQQATVTQQSTKAWPWADTWPVAKLHVPSTNTTMVVLEGVSGEAMAFGPGRMTDLSKSAETGLFGIGGHRDSHLNFVKDLSSGAQISLQTIDGASAVFEVSEQFVVDTSTEKLKVDAEQHALMLVTCYPFHAFQTGGPLRYVVIANPVQLAAKAPNEYVPHADFY